jgi:methionyl-tRNA formyltransferase
MLSIVYLGTPEFAVPPLLKLINCKNVEIAAVISQPDRKKDRKGRLQGTPVKETALKHGLKVLQFEKIKNNCGELKNLNADLFITCAYGQILSQEVLNVPKHGVFNIHASLLPRYRGAAPAQWAIINGETKTGVTIMRTDIGIDTGDIILQKEAEITCCDTAGTLLQRLSLLGADAIAEALELLESGKITYTPQDGKAASYYPLIKKSDAEIDFSQSSVAVRNKIRAFNPAPVCFTALNGEILKVYSAEIIEEDSLNADFGTVVSSDAKKGLYVTCGRGIIRLSEIQLAGGKVMADTELLKGKKIPVGSALK